MKSRSIEYNLIYSVLNSLPNFENNIAGIIESYIFKNIIIYSEKDLVVLEEYTLRFDQKHGKYKRYFKDGITLHTKCNYNYGLLEGEKLSYYKTGVLNRKENYKNGLLDGTLFLYYSTPIDSIPILKSITNFTNGIINGVHKIWNRNGGLLLECEYKNALMINKYIEYYDPADIILNDGLLSDEEEENENRNENRSIKMLEIDFNEFGVINGLLKKYSDRGLLLLEIEYKNGEKNGFHKIYHKRIGTLFIEKHYSNGLLNGSYKKYLKNNKCILSTNFKDGKLHSEFIKYTPFLSADKMYIKCNYNNGYLDGEYIIYNLDGSEMVVNNYSYSDKITHQFETDLEEENIEILSNLIHF
jgi:antitoxin component YwqK of YwqJK toxin-antitoxin module